jgi:1-acyl-sn-glycerol-3-phosphate acyltransferase
MTPTSDQPAHYEPLDTDYVAEVLDVALGRILDHYFRPRLIGASKLPARGPIILAANHSGTAFPYDAMVLDATLWRRDGLKPDRKFRSMYEKELAVTWWMRPFGLDNFWRRAGGVDQTFDNFDRLLARGDRIIYYPEGVPGIGKGFQHRYQLQPFKTSFIVLAARHNAPVYPVHIVNGEWIIPFNFTWKPLDRLMQKLFHVPFLPLPLGCTLPVVLPFTWFLALPARLVMTIGKPFDMAQRLWDVGVRDFQAPDRTLVRIVAEQVRAEMQRDLDRAVARCGRWPINLRSLRRALAHAAGPLTSLMPWGWPISFIRHDRDRRRAPAASRLRAALRDWDLLGFYLPFGWPLLSLARAWRRPPCGYRGLTRKERREQEGAFHWHLKDRPLPPRHLEFGLPSDAPAKPATGGRARTPGAPAGDRVSA